MLVDSPDCEAAQAEQVVTMGRESHLKAGASQGTNSKICPHKGPAAQTVPLCSVSGERQPSSFSSHLGTETNQPQIQNAGSHNPLAEATLSSSALSTSSMPVHDTSPLTSFFSRDPTTTGSISSTHSEQMNGNPGLGPLTVTSETPCHSLEPERPQGGVTKGKL